MGALAVRNGPSTVGGTDLRAEEVGTSQTISSAFSSPRYCRECGTQLTTARLQARPNAVECVACLENSGDVPRIRQYTETTKDGEVIATHFRDNPRIERQLQHGLDTVASEGAFRVAAGDDAELRRPSRALLETVRIQDIMTED